MTESQCYWNEGGERCQADGTVSPSLHGKPPRFCLQHFNAYLSTKPKSEDVDLPIDDHVNQVVPRNDGESLHDWSMRCRDYLLGRRP